MSAAKRTAVIIAAAQGIGRKTAEVSVERGYKLAPIDLQAPESPDTYQKSDITGRVPMGRFLAPDDIARAIAFLADERESGFVNGHTMTVDGGWTADGSWETLRLRHR